MIIYYFFVLEGKTLIKGKKEKKKKRKKNKRNKFWVLWH